MGSIAKRPAVSKIDLGAGTENGLPIGLKLSAAEAATAARPAREPMQFVAKAVGSNHYSVAINDLKIVGNGIVCVMHRDSRA